MAGLTARFLDSVKPVKGKRLEWADDRVRGLYFRVAPGGEKSWSVRYRVDDQSQRRVKLGSYPALTLAAARDIALTVLAERVKGADPSADRRKAKREAKAGRLEKPQTFGALVELYLEQRGATKRATTRASRKWLYETHLKKHLGAVRLVELDRSTFRLSLRAIGEKAQVTANRAHAFATTVLNWAVNEELIAANPIAGMPKLFEETTRDRVLRDEELGILSAALADAPLRNDVHVSARLCDALRLLLLTMTRRNDVAGMRGEEIDRTTKTWTIPAERHKSGRPHTVPLSPPAWEIVADIFEAAVAARKDDDRKRLGDTWAGPAFPNARDAETSIDPKSLTRAMARVLKGVKLPKGQKLARMTPHDLRRTASTIVASERVGVAPHVVSALLGHQPEGPAVTSVYNRHRYDAEKRLALKAWAVTLAQIINTKKDAPNDEARS